MFNNLKIKEVRRETPDAVSVHFEIDPSVKSQYEYKPGQYLTLKLNVNGEELRRAYSLCTSPFTDTTPAIAVKRVEDGRASNYINDHLKAGDVIEVMKPMGNFTPELNEFFGRQFVLYAGGSGITPMLSILKSILHVEPSSHVTLVYGNRNEESIIFNKELYEIEGHYADRFKIVNCLADAPSGWNGEIGMLTPERVKAILALNIDTDITKAQHFICGPSPMMSSVKEALESLNVPSDKINIEYFTSDIEQGEGGDASVGDTLEPFTGVAQVHVDVNGDEYDIEVKEADTILHVAQEAGIDPPFACQSGICTTCRAKMLEGSVHMDELEGLTEGELADGYILTCQAHPKSAKIVIRYE